MQVYSCEAIILLAYVSLPTWYSVLGNGVNKLSWSQDDGNIAWYVTVINQDKGSFLCGPSVFISITWGIGEDKSQENQ